MFLMAISTSTAKKGSDKWFNQTMNNQNNHSFKRWAIPEKIQIGGVEEVDFPGVLKKKHVEIPVVN